MLFRFKNNTKKLWDIQGKLEKEFQALLKVGENDASR